MILFFIVLPEAIALPHGTIYTFSLGTPVPEIAEVPMYQTRELGPLPYQGELFVSLRFWRRRGEYLEVKEEIEAALEVMRAAVPADALPEPADRDGEMFPVYRTVVEAVTLLVADESSDPVSAAYDRCVEHIAKLVRGYRVSTHDPVAYITRERLPMAIPFMVRNLEGGHWSGPSLLQANLNVPTAAALPDWEPSAEQIHDMNLRLEAMLGEHPLTPYLERSLDAHRSLERDGETASSVIFAQLSVETLLDGVLMLMLWEENVEAEKAASQVFSGSFTRRVRSEFHPRLGGNWHPDQTGPVHDVLRQLAPLRGRVVHAGYVPSIDEAREALDITGRIDAHLRARLAASATRFPRTSLMCLGRPGLERHGAWHGPITRFVAEQADDEPNWLNAFGEWRDVLNRSRT